MKPASNINDLLVEAREAQEHFWFVRTLTVREQTNATITVHLSISTDLFVQIFLSERSGRWSMALIGPTGRLYGRDLEHGAWHRHPFGQPNVHEATPEGVSHRPVIQFMSEVEQLLVEHELI
ncbi:hypothetical protein [Candidatus Chloroploca sp. Khr17]|uniref:hypothetical protein n=1 Tax=Candidatus Chloroploca sp. Khr17 TaxID=2496869 RepID=UPI00101DAA6B|nr:hypothetical protein [Candidatus Chloroploca sp. Khr17]